MSTAAIVKYLNRLNHLPEDRRLPLALGLAVFISLVLVGVSVVIYSAGGYAKFDLSRPGFEGLRKQVATQGEPQQMYDHTSPVTKSAIDSFVQTFDASVKGVNGYGDFRDQALDDNDLQLNGSVGTPN